MQLRTLGMNEAEHIDVIGLLGPLWRYAKALARDETHVKDLVQETLVRAYKQRGSFR